MPLRLAPGWRLVAALSVPPALALGLLVAAWSGGAGGPAPVPALPAAALAAPPAPGLLVYVSGAVVRPGLYRLQRGDRAYAAIAAAGGFSRDADPTRLPDLAERLRDGEQIKVPFRKGAGGSVTVTKLDLNAATYAELLQVPGFTPDLARAAVAYRRSYGGFASTRDLVTVLGMSAAAYAAARAYVKV